MVIVFLVALFVLSAVFAGFKAAFTVTSLAVIGLFLITEAGSRLLKLAMFGAVIYAVCWFVLPSYHGEGISANTDRVFESSRDTVKGGYRSAKNAL